MKRIVNKMMIAGLAMVLLAGCGTSGKETEKEDITVAFLPNEKAEVRSKDAFKMLQEEIQVALGDGYNVKISVLDDYAAVTEAMISGTAQIAWESGATFAATYLKDNKIVPILSYGANADPTVSGYSGFIATHVDNKKDFEGKSKEEQLKQLKNQSFGFVSPTSTSGTLVPTTTFWKLFGPDGDKSMTSKEQINVKKAKDGGLFSDVQYGGDHPGAVTLIKQKKVYAGAFCCNYGNESKDDLYIIDTTFVPNGPLWVNSEKLGKENMDKLVKHFTELTPEKAVNKDFFDKEKGFFFEAEEDTANFKFFETDVNRYQFILDMYKDK